MADSQIDLDEVRQQLWDTANQLWNVINDPDTEASALPSLRREFFEVNHRQQLLLGKALTSQTKALAAKAKLIGDARDKVKAILDKIESIVA